MPPVIHAAEYPGPVTPPRARSHAEVDLYLDLQPCAACGSRGFTGSAATIVTDGRVYNRYRGSCRRCGGVRQFTFQMPTEPRLPSDEVSFGGPEPSELIDPGEWLALASRTAGRGEAATREELLIAAASLDEVLKFVPDGADVVPPQAFRTDDGREAYAREPYSFDRESLGAVAAHYRRLAEER
jgi:hypothetical protein